jgi:hypothetical protein
MIKMDVLEVWTVYRAGRDMIDHQGTCESTRSQAASSEALELYIYSPKLGS